MTLVVLFKTNEGLKPQRKPIPHEKASNAANHVPIEGH